MRLSYNFSLWEMTKSQTADRLRINNEPDEAQTENLRLLCKHGLEPVRKHYSVPIRPSSGFRSAALNEALGSGPNSQHTKGQAADFEVPWVDNMALALWIMDNVVYDQLILEYYKEDVPNSGWIHLSYIDPPSKNRRQSKIFDGKVWKKLD